MKIRFKNEFGGPMNLLQADQITLHFEREDGTFLVKRDMTILDAQRGEVEFKLNDFELQALKNGMDQDFFGKVLVGDECLTLRFAKGLCVTKKDGRNIIHEQNKAGL